jgi:hypothetical protein
MKIINILIVCFFGVFASACGNPNIELAKKAIERDLLDPASVQYRDVKEFSEGVVCGEINAKNGLGGYVGYKTFIYNGMLKDGAYFETDDRVQVKWWCSDKPNKRISHDQAVFKWETLCEYHKTRNEKDLSEITCNEASNLKNKKLTN